MTSEEYEAWRVQKANETPGNLQGEDCPLCLNRGYTMELREGYRVCVECGCMAKRRAAARIRKSGLENMLERYTFDAYQTPEAWQKAAKKKALQYLTDNNGKWFVVAGVVGSGKSHLCTAICGELMKSGMDARYMLWREESRKLKAMVNDNAYDQILQPFKDVRVLYIDDFFKVGDRNITSGDINLAFELLNHRYNDVKKITVISTEWTIEQIMDIDQALGSRIYERSKDYYLRISGDGKNWRLRRS